MGKIEKIIKSEILRLAKREMRATFNPLRREAWRMKLKLSGLLKDFNSLNRLVREQVLQGENKKMKLEASVEEAKASRLTPERIRLLRKKLGISQRQLAILAGVSLGAVVGWEKGKFHPNINKKATLVAIRKLRKREVKKVLTVKSEEAKKMKGPEAKTKVVKKKLKRKK